MKRKIVFLNGPARSGKDAAAYGIHANTRWAVARHKFAEPLKRAAHELIGLRGTPAAAFEKKKDENLSEFFGLTPRELYIKLSEDFAKKVFGEMFFGNVAINSIYSAETSIKAGVLDVPWFLHVFSDSGFASEALPLVEEFGANNCLLVRIRREGYSFAGDSRSYIDLPVETIELTNNSTLHEWEVKVHSTVMTWAED